MYTVTANGKALFSSDDTDLVREVYRIYKNLYEWASVRVLKARIRR
jgi:hypothetical protein